MPPSLVTTHARWFWLIAKLAVACGMVWFLLHQGALDFEIFLEGAVNLKLLAVGLALNLTMISLGAVRWRLLLGSQGIVVPFAWAHKITYLTLCFNLLVPGAVGGDALRMTYVARKTSSTKKGAAILTVLADRMLGLYTMLAIALVATLFNLDIVLDLFPLRLLALSLVLTVGGGPLAVLLLFWGIQRIPMLRRQIDTPPGTLPPPQGWFHTFLFQTVNAAHLFRQAKGKLAAALAVSSLAQIIEVGAILWIAHALSMLTLPIDHFFVAAPLAWVANVLPVSPGGLGVGEAAFAQICQWLQAEPSVTAFGTLFLVNRMLLMVAALPGLWVYLAYRTETAQDKGS